MDFMGEAAQDRLRSGKNQPQIAKVLADDRQRNLLLDRHAAYLSRRLQHDGELLATAAFTRSAAGTLLGALARLQSA
ncbi:hypothetical protein [Imhoffiella purpurea]|uniref:Uncharacterized protein n=1 Tax=Imhoffiella purpurea TaxID=1249627 RepID=W9V8T8_9GAMM|nr:hypothetical protein [Imhoffiella purpurea]EXJ15819.1 hypothetical protein D779_1043 [Imhoffiella purpurea]